MTYPDFEKILGSEHNKEKNPDKSYTSKYQNMLLAVMAKK